MRFMRQSGFTAVQMAKQFGCSVSLVYKKLAINNLHMRAKYLNADNSVLDTIVTSVHERNRNAGNEVRMILYCVITT